VRALRRATATILIVMAYSTDPVGNGFVAGLAHPGGNITGLVVSTDSCPHLAGFYRPAGPHL
jgi:putative tryptophan/tyrosine transport system substrate-binding protein